MNTTFAARSKAPRHRSVFDNALRAHDCRRFACSGLACLLLIFCAALRIPAAEVYRGIQAIGFANWDRISVTNLARIFTNAGGNLEVTLLHPDVFSGKSANWPNLNILLGECFPTGQSWSISKLRVTVYFGYHGKADTLAMDDGAHGPVWNALSHKPLRGNDRQVLEQWDKRRTMSYLAWLTNTLSARPDITGRLSFVLSPLLEDKESKTSLSKLQQRIKSKVRPTLVRAGIDAGIVQFRRSPIGSDKSRVGQYLELHGPITDSNVTKQFKKGRGDAFSNDGNFVWVDVGSVPGSGESSGAFPSGGPPVPLSTFAWTGKSLATNKGVSLLLWRPAYNGMPQYSKATPLPQRTNIHVNLAVGELEAAALTNFLGQLNIP